MKNVLIIAFNQPAREFTEAVQKGFRRRFHFNPTWSMVSKEGDYFKFYLRKVNGDYIDTLTDSNPTRMGKKVSNLAYDHIFLITTLSDLSSLEFVISLLANLRKVKKTSYSLIMEPMQKATFKEDWKQDAYRMIQLTFQNTEFLSFEDFRIFYNIDSEKTFLMIRDRVIDIIEKYIRPDYY